MVSMNEIKNIVGIITKHIKPEKVILFGSYASDSPTDDSDVDLLIVKDMHMPRYQRGRIIRKHLRRLKIPVDLIVYTQKEIDKWKNVETAFITQIVKNGVVLYG